MSGDGPDGRRRGHDAGRVLLLQLRRRQADHLTLAGVACRGREPGIGPAVEAPEVLRLPLAPPGLVGPVPVDRSPQAFLEAVARLPSQRAHPTGLERVAVIVAGPVGDEPLEGWRLAAQPQDMVRDLLPADLRADPQVVGRARLSLP